MRIAYLTCAVFLLVVITTGCRREEPEVPADVNEAPATEGPAPDQTADFDGDGVSNVDEMEVYHTSPETRDTDGDGYDDYQEIYEFGYDPSNPTKFNPLVADVPRINIELTTPPKVTVVYRKSTGGTETVETGRTDTTATTVMSSKSFEQNWSVTAGVTASYPWNVSVSASGTYGQSHSWTGQQSAENQQALTEMRSKSQSSDLTQESGHIKVGVAIANAGHIPFTVQNLSLTAFRLEGTRLWPVAQLEADSARPFFDMGTWAPGQRVDNILFVAKDVTLSEVEELLAGDLLVQVSKYELKDENGQSFGHRMAAIDAACARIGIDYGGDAPAESYMVSTRTATGGRVVPLNTILDTLGIPYEMGTVPWTYRKRTPGGQLAIGDDATETGRTRNGLLRLRDVSVDPQQGGYWLITHEVPAAPSGSVTHRHDLLVREYKLEDIRLKSRQTIQLAYVRDPDRDDLSTPAEHALGTDPWQADTDGDAVADGDEIRDGTDPLWDNALPPPRIGAVKVGRGGRRVSLGIGVPAPDDGSLERVRIQWGDASLAEEIPKPQKQEETIAASHRYASTGTYRIVVTPYGGPRSPGQPYEVEVSVTPALVRDMIYQVGAKGLDRVRQVAVGGDGSIFLAGNVPESSALWDDQTGSVFLVALDREGRPRWSKRWGEEKDGTMPGGLATDGAGNVYVTVHGPDYYREPEEGFVEEPLERLGLLKYDAKGKKEHEQRFLTDVGSLATDYAGYASLITWEDGGQGRRSWRVEQYTGHDAVMERGWPPGLKGLAGIIHLEPGGNVHGIAAHRSNSFYVCGHQPTFSSDGALIGSSFVARYQWRWDNYADRLWVSQHGDNAGDQSVAIAADQRGNAYVVDVAIGHSSNELNRGRHDVRLVKYDPAGKLLWTRRFGTRLSDIGSSVAVWPPIHPRGAAPQDAEVVYVAGITQGDLNDENADLVPDESRFSAFLTSYDADGARTSLHQFATGGVVPQEILEPQNLKAGDPIRIQCAVSAFVTTDAEGNVYLAGSSETSLDADYTNKGSADIFLMRFAPNPEVRK